MTQRRRGGGGAPKKAPVQKFEPRLDVLPAAQRKLWDELGATPAEFVLYGGTALGLRLGHRQSEDFDFFSNEPFVPLKLAARIPYLKGAEIFQEARDTLTCIVDRGGPVRISFFGGLPFNRVGDPETAQGSKVKVASLLDIAANKVRTIIVRASLKDYLDIAALMDAGVTIPQAIAAAKAVYGSQYNAWLSKKALACFEENDVRQLSAATRQRLVAAAEALDVESLPAINALKGIV
jgi:hypothetical protein